MTTLDRTGASFHGEFSSDEAARRRFDAELGAYLHGHHPGVDVAAVTDLLDDLAGHVARADVSLTPEDDGRAHVTIAYTLPARRTT